MAKKSSLGKGLDSLIPTELKDNLTAPRDLNKILVQDIKATKSQPRKHFDDDDHKSLVRSVKLHGVLQPIVVHKDGQKYAIIAGERRWRAAKEAGLADIPAIVRSINDQAKLELALVENIQRRDLSPLELAESFLNLQSEFNLKPEDISKRVGKAAPTVRNIIRLLDLPNAAKIALQRGRISEGHARSILALSDDKRKQQELLDYILNKDWSVRKAEAFVVAYKEGAKDKKEASNKTETVTKQTKSIEKHLGTPVRLRPTAKGGYITIRYKTKKELDDLAKKLSK